MKPFQIVWLIVLVGFHESIALAVDFRYWTEPAYYEHVGICNGSSNISFVDEYLLSGWARKSTENIQQWNFFHIPKSGGSSLRISLKQVAANQNLTVCARDFSLCFGSDAQLIIGHQYRKLIPNARLRGIQVSGITVLRHPVARMVSLYHYVRHTKSNPAYNIISQLTFEEFLLASNYPFEAGDPPNQMTRLFCGESIRCSTDMDYALGEAKFHLLEDFSAVGIQECYDATMALFESRMPFARRDKNGLVVKKVNVGHYTNVTSPHPAVPSEFGAAASLGISTEDFRLALRLNMADLKLFEFAVFLFQSSVRQNFDQQSDN